MHTTIYLKDSKLWDQLKARALIKGMSHHVLLEKYLRRALDKSNAHTQNVSRDAEYKNRILEVVSVGHHIGLDLALETLEPLGASMRRTKEILMQLQLVGILVKTHHKNLFKRVR